MSNAQTRLLIGELDAANERIAELEAVIDQQAKTYEQFQEACYERDRYKDAWERGNGLIEAMDKVKNIQLAYIAELEQALDASKRLGICTPDIAKDAERYRCIRNKIAPRQLVENGLRDGGDLAMSESIAARIDWMVDAAIDAARGE